MPIVIDPTTGQRKFVHDTSGTQPRLGPARQGTFNPASPYQGRTQGGAEYQPNEFAKGLRAGVEQVRGLGKSAVGAGAGLLGYDETAEEFTQDANENFARASRIGPTVTDFNTATESLENFGDFLAGGIGQAIPTFATAAGGGLAGLGAKGLLRSSISPTVAGAAGAGGATVALEGGGNFNAMMNDPVARQNKTISELAGISLAAGVPAAALDTLPLVVAARRFGLGFKARKLIDSKMKEFAKATGGQSLLEGSTEAAQTAISRAAQQLANENVEILGEEGINELLTAGTIGAAFGGIVGGTSSLPGLVSSRIEEQRTQKANASKQAEATFQRLREINDPDLQSHLDGIEGFGFEDSEIQEEMESIRKDFGVAKPKFEKLSLRKKQDKGPEEFLPEDVQSNAIPGMDIDIETARDLAAVFNNPRISDAAKRMMADEYIYDAGGFLSRFREEEIGTQVSEAELDDSFSFSGTEQYTVDLNDFIGNKNTNTAFDTTTFEGKRTLASTKAKAKAAELSAENPDTEYKAVRALDAFRAKAQEARAAGQEERSIEEVVLELAKDDSFRSTTPDRMMPEDITTYAKAAKYLKNKYVVTQERKPSALRSQLPDRMTPAEVRNDFTQEQLNERARAFAEIRDVESQTDETLKEAYLNSADDIDYMLDEMSMAELIEHPMASDLDLTGVEDVGVEVTGYFRDLQKSLRDLAGGITDTRRKQLAKTAKQRRDNAAIRTPKAAVVKEFFENKDPSAKDVAELRRTNSEARYLVYARDDKGKVTAIRPQAIIQKKFQKMFPGESISDPERLNTVFNAGMADIMIDNNLSLINSTFSDDLVVFVDADKRAFTLGEIRRTTEAERIKGAISGQRALANNIKGDINDKKRKGNLNFYERLEKRIKRAEENLAINEKKAQQMRELMAQVAEAEGALQESTFGLASVEESLMEIQRDMNRAFKSNPEVTGDPFEIKNPAAASLKGRKVGSLYERWLSKRIQQSTIWWERNDLDSAESMGLFEKANELYNQIVPEGIYTADFGFDYTEPDQFADAMRDIYQEVKEEITTAKKFIEQVEKPDAYAKLLTKYSDRSPTEVQSMIDGKIAEKRAEIVIAQNRINQMPELVREYKDFHAETMRWVEKRRAQLDKIEAANVEFFKKYSNRFTKKDPAIRELLKNYTQLQRDRQDLSVRAANSRRNKNFLMDQVARLESKNVLVEFPLWSKDLGFDFETRKLDLRAQQKTQAEEQKSLLKKEETTFFANAAQIARVEQARRYIQQIEKQIDEFYARGDMFADRFNDDASKKIAYLKQHINDALQGGEPRPITLPEQSGLKYERGVLPSKSQMAQGVRNVIREMKPIARRLKQKVEVIDLQQAMKEWNMTQYDLEDVKGMYFKGKMYVNDRLSPAVMREVIAHELGHSIYENELRAASQKTRDAIYEEFSQWRERVKGDSVHEIIKSKKAFNIAMQYLTESENRAFASLPTEDQKYLLDFEEWFADQVARWDGTQPKTALGKFFKKIADLIKKVMGRNEPRSVREFLDAVAARNLVVSVKDRAQRFHAYVKAEKGVGANSLFAHLVKMRDLQSMEALANELPEIFTEKDLGLLGRAFTQGNVRSQLYKLYPEYFRADMFDNDIKLTIAAGLANWAQGHLQVGPQVMSVYNKALNKIAKSFGGKTEMQKHIAALDKIKRGEVIFGRRQDLELLSDRTNIKSFTDTKGFNDTVVKLGDVFMSVFQSANDRMRSTKNPALIRVANMFHSQTGNRLVKQGYFQEKQRMTGRFLSRATAALKDAPDGVIEEMRSGKLKSAAAKAMRQLYDEMYDYAKKLGVDIKLRKNYVPRVWDKEAIAQRTDELRAILEQYRIEDPDLTINRLLGLEEGHLEDWVIPYTPNNTELRRRALGKIPDQVLADAGFIANDITYITAHYVESLVKHAEYVKRFGSDNKKLIDITNQARELGATDSDIEIMHSYMQAMMGLSGHETNNALAKLLGLKEPPLTEKINPVLQQALSTVLVIRNLALLSLATLTSLADPIGISVRSGSLSDTGRALKVGMQEIWNSVAGRESEVKELADALGILESHMTNVALQWEYGGTYMSSWARRVNDEFFKWTGLTGLTRLTRTMSLGAAHSFIARHASNPTSNSQRFLEELNLTPEDILLTPDGKSVRILTFEERQKAPESEVRRDDRVRAAMNQFVDESILRPNAAQRPIWASDPHYMLVFHLKAFMYSFHDRILRRGLGEVTQNNNLAPFAALTMFVPALLFIDSLRDMIKHGGTPSYKQGWDTGDYTFNAMERAGLFGTYQQFFDIHQSQQYGGTGAEPVFGGMAFPFQNPKEWLPLSNLY